MAAVAVADLIGCPAPETTVTGAAGKLFQRTRTTMRQKRRHRQHCLLCILPGWPAAYVMVGPQVGSFGADTMNSYPNPDREEYHTRWQPYGSLQEYRANTKFVLRWGCACILL